MVRADGISEPRSDYPEYFRELEMGVNEQSFEVWEYAAMLARAGLEIVDAKFDRGSAKIAAKTKRNIQSSVS